MLVKRVYSNTKFLLPIKMKSSNITFNWYYDCEFSLFKAYRQLIAINGNFIPLTPKIDGIEVYI